jgi:uncharacterized protein YwqG
MSDRVDVWIAALEAEASPCAAFAHAEGEAQPAGRLGGLPAIAGIHDWPQVDGRPLSFVAEIDLTAVSAVFDAPWLPRSGRLHFFYDMVEWPAGFDPADRGHWAVLYTPADAVAGITESPADLPPDLVFPAVRLAAANALSYPDPLLLEERLGQLSDLPDAEWQRINDYRQQDDRYPLHQMGGHPSPIQAPDLGYECQLASNGVYLGGPEGYASPEAAALAPGAADWRLLLQVDSDDRADMMWGDVGMLYFMIRESDALARDFSRTWLLMQCT